MNRVRYSDNSQFYDNYPSSASLWSKSHRKWGINKHFENYIGVAFSREDLLPGVFSIDGLFWYADGEGKTVNAKYANGRSPL